MMRKCVLNLGAVQVSACDMPSVYKTDKRFHRDTVFCSIPAFNLSEQTALLLLKSISRLYDLHFTLRILIKPAIIVLVDIKYTPPRTSLGPAEFIS